MSRQLCIIIANEDLKQTVILVIVFFDEKKFAVFNSLELQWWYKIPEIALLLIFNFLSFLPWLWTLTFP